MLIVFFIITQVLSLIPLEENATILLVEFPDYEITVEDTLVRLRKIQEGVFSDLDSNVAKISMKKGRYVIDYHGLSLYAEEANGEVSAKIFEEVEAGFYFDIISSEFGQKIMRGDMCLQKGQWDESMLGYKLIEAPCSDNVYELFEIRRLVKRTKDNNEKNADIFIHDRNINEKQVLY